MYAWRAFCTPFPPPCSPHGQQTPWGVSTPAPPSQTYSSAGSRICSCSTACRAGLLVARACVLAAAKSDVKVGSTSRGGGERWIG